MKLELITLDGVKVNNDVYEVLLPTPDGVIAILPGHERIVTLAVNGTLAVRHKKGDLDSQIEYFATYGGVAEVSPTRIRILVDEADTADEIIAEEAEKALRQAESLKANAKNSNDLEKAQAEIDRHAVRLKVAGLRRHKR